MTARPRPAKASARTERPWAKLSVADRVEAVRELLKTTAPPAIAWKLRAPREDVDRIVALIRREGWIPSLQGGEAASRLAHNQEIACASQAPATSITQGGPVRLARSPAPDGNGTTVGAQPAARPHSAWDQMSGTARLKACIDGRKAGLSAAVIAAQLGTTRNSVIGYWHRSGVPLPPSAHGNGPKKVAAPKLPTTAQAKKPKISMPAAKPSKPIHGAGVASAIRARLVPAENRPALPPERVLEDAPAPRNLSIMDLTNMVCRYPIGDPKLPSFGFCGAGTEGRPPYCSYHHRIVFVPASERRRRSDETERKAA